MGGALSEAAHGRTIVLPGQTPDGEPILSALLKRSYAISPVGQCERSETDERLHPADVHFADPLNTSVRHESDFVPFKLATDVVIHGDAHAPDGRPAQEILASVAIGARHKHIAVIGDRVAQFRPNAAPVISEPAPFLTMPMRYERAFGGVDIGSDPRLACAYGRNHLGRGFMIRNTCEAVDGQALPNLEDPADRLTPERLCCGHFIHMDTLPAPQGFGWTSKYWQPRSRLAGIMPADAEIARQLRAAYRLAVPPAQHALYDQTELPPMDFRFFNGASEGLVLPYLKGDETVRLRNMTQAGALDFVLPGDRPVIALDIGDGPSEGRVVLHSVTIRLDANLVDLVWRAAFPYRGPDWLPELRRLDLEVSG